ncbi:MAG: YggS family pyridoxal phosphate-dependent enzyme [Ruminococcus sp.]|jgi:pyridoxal phosphate enzyme (YggS family)|nr:YggS family pyridoxal phosphate-dependent enzyme [Ruminococcus sp.]MBQ7009903.1 YggS family pyridoxal phosphate-dependent enzyme [Ruminococcus sp.]MBR4022386.1 YggS family pyridoxal phosphate-dependent enzyme [Ruminococcus sp.]
MENRFGFIDENLKRITFNINEAVAKYRNPDEKVSLMAVTKTVEPEYINYAVSKGVTLLGENRVQEYQSKKDYYDKSAEVHFIGHLQTNKVKYIIDSVKLIQSVDSIKLALEIDRLSEKSSKITDILCEVNIGGEESKGGIDRNEAKELIYQMSELKNIRVCGLMTIPPPYESEKFLYEMKMLYDDISAENINNVKMNILSMGMSNDYETAIKYGSTLVRIGTGLFGNRIYK